MNNEQHTPDSHALARLIVLGLEEVGKSIKPVGGKGRPSDPRWKEKPPVPMSRATKEELEWLSAAAGIGYTQLAARILETALTRSNREIANAAQGPRAKVKTPASYYLKLAPSVRYGLDESKLAEALKLLTTDDWAELFSDLAKSKELAVLAEFMGRTSSGGGFLVHLSRLACVETKALSPLLEREVEDSAKKVNELSVIREHIRASTRVTPYIAISLEAYESLTESRPKKAKEYKTLRIALLEAKPIEIRLPRIGVFDNEVMTWAGSILSERHGISLVPEEPVKIGDLVSAANDCDNKGWTCFAMPLQTLSSFSFTPFSISPSNIFFGYVIMRGSWTYTWSISAKVSKIISKLQLKEYEKKILHAQNESLESTGHSPLLRILHFGLFVYDSTLNGLHPDAAVVIHVYDRQAKHFLVRLAEYIDQILVQLGSSAAELGGSVEDAVSSVVTISQMGSAFDEYAAKYCSEINHFAVATGNLFSRTGLVTVIDRDDIHSAIREASLRLGRASSLVVCQHSLEAADHLHTSIHATYKGDAFAWWTPQEDVSFALAKTLPSLPSYEETFHAYQEAEKAMGLDPSNFTKQDSIAWERSESLRVTATRATTIDRYARLVELDRICAFTFDCIEHARFSMQEFQRYCTSIENGVTLDRVAQAFAKCYRFLSFDEMPETIYDAESVFCVPANVDLPKRIHSRFRKLRREYRNLRDDALKQIAGHLGIFTKLEAREEAEELLDIAERLAASFQFLFAREIVAQILMADAIEGDSASPPNTAFVRLEPLAESQLS